MPTPILATKLFIPPPRPKIVSRPRLIKQLCEGLPGKLTLLSAPAGFGKTTLVSEWLASPFGAQRPVAWLSLDEGENDPTRFLAYLVAAVQTIAPKMGAGILAALEAPQSLWEPAAREALLTALLNDITTLPDKFVLVLDDYHAIDATVVDQILGFLIERQPPPMHLVITTREDPPLPLARLRARGNWPNCAPPICAFPPPKPPNFSARSWVSISRQRKLARWSAAPKAGLPVCN
jgi:LuxR family transcriptional regulator, maltose regulon positive regulatory protein